MQLINLQHCWWAGRLSERTGQDSGLQAPSVAGLHACTGLGVLLILALIDVDDNTTIPWAETATYLLRHIRYLNGHRSEGIGEGHKDRNITDVPTCCSGKKLMSD